MAIKLNFQISDKNSIEMTSKARTLSEQAISWVLEFYLLVLGLNYECDFTN